MIFTVSEHDPPVTAFEVFGLDDIDTIIHHETTTLKALYPRRVLEDVAKLHDGQLFSSSNSQEFVNSVLDILKIALVISIVHIVILQFYTRRRSHRHEVKRSSQKNIADNDAVDTDARVDSYRDSYQMTNMCVNFVLGCLGIYHYLRLPSNVPISERITMPDYVLFAKLQIGFNLWAVPVGLLMVNESTTMLIHHACVILIAGMSCFCTAGYRYHCPFFYGLIEISSVPLSIMNMFKNNRKWIENKPSVYAAVRVTFAVAFLTTRVVMWIPQMFDFLYIISLYFWTCQSPFCYAVNGVNFSNGIFLTCLQLFWASEIVKGLLMMTGLKKRTCSRADTETKKEK